MFPLPILDTSGYIFPPCNRSRKCVAFVLLELVSVKAHESNGKLEGISNKIGAMQRVHYGLRDLHFLSLRLLTLHLAKHTFYG
ncbi:MAG: transposase [Verrucomicrobia bacterium]|nr:transposase [Verrucomicrobiota bacterium]